MGVVFVVNENNETVPYPAPPEPTTHSGTIPAAGSVSFARNIKTFGGIVVAVAESTQTGYFVLEGSVDGSSWVKVEELALAATDTGYYGMGVEVPWAFPWIRVRVTNTGASSASCQAAMGFTKEV